MHNEIKHDFWELFKTELSVFTNELFIYMKSLVPKCYKSILINLSKNEFSVTLYNMVSFVNITCILCTFACKQWTMHLLHYLLIFVNVS